MYIKGLKSIWGWVHPHYPCGLPHRPEVQSHLQLDPGNMVSRIQMETFDRLLCAGRHHRSSSPDVAAHQQDCQSAKAQQLRNSRNSLPSFLSPVQHGWMANLSPSWQGSQWKLLESAYMSGLFWKTQAYLMTMSTVASSNCITLVKTLSLLLMISKVPSTKHCVHVSLTLKLSLGHPVPSMGMGAAGWSSMDRPHSIPWQRELDEW